MDEKVSIIVPIYKVEKYVEKCIKSLQMQTYDNIEIVLVDDGSPDRCPVIADEFARNDPRIKVIHKQNGGLSDARNEGIKIATGAYILYVDSDDYVSEDYVSYLVGIIKKYDADISICEFLHVDENGHILNKSTNSGKEILMSTERALEEMLRTVLFSNSASGKLFRKSLISDNGIQFPIGCHFEDVATTYKIMMKANKVCYGARANYFYLIRDGSISHNSFNVRRLDAIIFAKKMCSDILLCFPDLRKRTDERLFQAYTSLLKNLNQREHGDIYKDTSIEIKKLSKIILRDTTARKENRIMALIATFSVDLLHSLLRKRCL